eukprot:4841479-Prymnesium_polylepis.1
MPLAWAGRVVAPSAIGKSSRAPRCCAGFTPVPVRIILFGYGGGVAALWRVRWRAARRGGGSKAGGVRSGGA